MESAAIGILALSGIAAVAAMVAFAFGRHVVSALDSAFFKWRRLGFVGRVMAVVMVAIAAVEAQKEEGKCLNVGMSECLNQNGDDSLLSLKHSNIKTFEQWIVEVQSPSRTADKKSFIYPLFNFDSRLRLATID